MRATVWSGEQEAGFLEWTPDAYGVQISLDCALPAEPQKLVRCYGQTEGEPLLIGLPEPVNGRLRLSRHLSRETLKGAGCLYAPPMKFYLSDGTVHPLRASEPEQAADEPEVPVPQRFRTGDEVLDVLLQADGVQVEQTAAGVVLRCPFACDAPFALAPVFTLCEVEDGSAVLQWPK